MIEKKAYAKINIGLDIVKKRPDGYHDIDTIMQTVSLHDVITVSKSEGITVSCSDSSVPAGPENTVYKAASLFFNKTGLDPEVTGAKIHIEKNIPSRAGLGGGSSDGAAVLIILNYLYCTDLGTPALLELALEIGSDVPFFIKGGTCRAMGRGEILTPLKGFNDRSLVVIMPDETVSTPEAYSRFAGSAEALHPDMDRISEAVSSGDLDMLASVGGNTFEELVIPYSPLIGKARHDILETGASVAMMTGSGAAVYGIYDKEELAEDAYRKLSETYTAFLCKTIGGRE